ncbi:MAG: 16S rRNA processing protein RimM [Deltaproteobacteria bacterium]|nr:16S rRNA processing protein RimM [Deltaproteobacteria bacterium]
MKNDDFLLIGKIVGAHGVKGAVRIYPYGSSYSVFTTGTLLYIKQKSAQAFIKHQITGVSSYKQIIRINLREVASRNEAEDLISSDIFIKKNLLEKPEAGTYYWDQLTGIFVFNLDEGLLGIVERIFSTGANDVLVVKNKKEEILIPFTKNVIKEVNLEKKIIKVDLPEGLPRYKIKI